MTQTTEQTIRELLDRQEILDCIYRYCRRVDRLDAIDDHGLIKAGVAEFITWAFDGHRENHRGHQHYIMNHTCELDGDTAHTGTYYVMIGQNINGTPLTLHGGRYIDRFERRNGHWAIAYRASLLEWVGGLNDPDLPPVQRVQPGPIARDHTDLSYQRPLGPDLG